MSGQNPYAPPTTRGDVATLPDAPKSAGWSLAGETILARQDAQLPMVDPFTGISEDTMTLRHISIRHSPRWLHGSLVVALACILCAGFIDLPGGLAEALGFTGAAAGLLYLVAGIFLSSVRIRVFTGRSSNLKISISAFLNTATSLTLLALIGSVSVGSDHPTMTKVIAILFGVHIISSIALRFRSRSLKCCRIIGGHHEIRGIHPEALRFLAEATAARRASLPEWVAGPQFD